MDPNNRLDNFFPAYQGNNDNLIILLTRTAEILTKWFSDAENLGPLPIENNFKPSMPEEYGSSLDSLFSEIESLIYNSFNPVHPGSLAHLDPPPLIISILGDLIAAGLNNNLLAHELSPCISFLEESICRWFSKKLGFDELSGGVLASGGTLSNLNALVAARCHSGLKSDPSAVFIISEDAHSSFKKCASIMGLPDSGLIKVNTDINGRMDIVHLKQTFENCIVEGKKIFAVVATLGTTMRGAIDSIKDISQLCKERNIWLHIDGSIGGIFALTNISIDGLCNVDRSNSITINPQKILGITKTSSLLVVSDFRKLNDAFSTGLPYIASSDDYVQKGEIGVQGSRPAEVIKLWLSLRFLGMNGIEAILKSSLDRKSFFEEYINKDKYEIYSGPLHIISLLPKGMNKVNSDLWTKKIRKELLKKKFMLSRSLFKNKYFLRIVFGNYNTSKSTIKDLSDFLNKI